MIENEIFLAHLLKEDHILIHSDANEEIDIADSAGSSLEMTSSSMQLMHYCQVRLYYQKLLVRFQLELKLQSCHSNLP